MFLLAAAAAALSFLFVFLGYSFYETLVHSHSESAEIVEGMRHMQK